MAAATIQPNIGDFCASTPPKGECRRGGSKGGGREQGGGSRPPPSPPPTSNRVTHPQSLRSELRLHHAAAAAAVGEWYQRETTSSVKRAWHLEAPLFAPAMTRCMAREGHSPKTPPQQQQPSGQRTEASMAGAHTPHHHQYALQQSAPGQQEQEQRQEQQHKDQLRTQHLPLASWSLKRAKQQQDIWLGETGAQEDTRIQWEVAHLHQAIERAAADLEADGACLAGLEHRLAQVCAELTTLDMLEEGPHDAPLLNPPTQGNPSRTENPVNSTEAPLAPVPMAMCGAVSSLHVRSHCSQDEACRQPPTTEDRAGPTHPMGAVWKSLEKGPHGAQSQAGPMPLAEKHRWQEGAGWSRHGLAAPPPPESRQEKWRHVGVVGHSIWERALSASQPLGGG